MFDKFNHKGRDRKCQPSPPVWLEREVLVCPAKLVGVLQKRDIKANAPNSQLASSVSGSLAPRVSGRKEVATEPARQMSIMIM